MASETFADELRAAVAGDKFTLYTELMLQAADLLDHKDEQINTRPAPAATDTGLVTVGVQYAHEHSITGRAMWGWQKEWKGCAAIGTRELVTRSQAEELLAAEIKLKQHWKDEAERFRIEFEKAAYEYLLAKARAEKAEADNAAQAARIKELETERTMIVSHATMGQTDGIGLTVNDISVRVSALRNELYEEGEKKAEALGAKLAAAEKALEPFSDHANDQAVDDTGWRDKETVKIVVSIGDLRKARAVLGGKPS